jgi:hypothetical protein
MAFAGGTAIRDASPITGAFARHQPAEAPPSQQAGAPERLTVRLDAKLAELEAAGRRVRWLEIGREELVTLFRELGDEAVRLDPDPARDCGWYGRFEVRFTGRELIWVMIDGEVPGDLDAHIVG